MAAASSSVYWIDAGLTLFVRSISANHFSGFALNAGLPSSGANCGRNCAAMSR